MKDVPGFEGEYGITHDGRVWSYKVGRFMALRGAGKSKRNAKRDYKTVVLWKRGKGCEYHYVHRLVGRAFLPNPEEKPEINHKNGVHDDNRVENLEWCTKIENNAHAIENGFTVRGIKNGQCKLDPEAVMEIRRRYANGEGSYAQLGREYGVNPATVGLIVRREKWAWLY